MVQEIDFSQNKFFSSYGLVRLMKNSVHDWNDSNKFEEQKQNANQTEHIIDHEKDDMSLVHLWDLLKCCLKLRKINLMH